MNISIIVLSYNHEEFICDCLESIKYQIMTYGNKNDTVEVVVTDDCSSDRTVEKVKNWEKENEGIFSNFILICNEQNIGTCNNYENALAKTSGDYIKLIGGDDLFPRNSMFSVFELLKDYDIVTGLPFEYIVGSENQAASIQTLTHKHQCINKELEGNPFYELIERRCFLNAPATYIRKDIATNPEVVSFVRSFLFTEDYPQWVKMSEIKKIKYIILNEYTIIYRRTTKSAYIVKKNDPRFLEDRIRIYTYIYNRTRSRLTKIIIMSFLSAFRKGQILPNKLNNAFTYINRFYWYKNRSKISPISIDEINKNLDYINNIIMSKRKKQ